MIDSYSNLLFLAAATAKVWYLVPLLIVISLVYGATRHETPKEILLHSYRSAVWMIVFLVAIGLVVWLGGYGVASQELSAKSAGVVLAAIAWIFGAFWIGGHVFKSSSKEGIFCIVSAGLYSLYYGVRNRDRFAFPVVVMVLAAGWILYALVAAEV